MKASKIKTKMGGKPFEHVTCVENALVRQNQLRIGSRAIRPLKGTRVCVLLHETEKKLFVQNYHQCNEKTNWSGNLFEASKHV